MKPYIKKINKYLHIFFLKFLFVYIINIIIISSLISSPICSFQCEYSSISKILEKKEVQINNVYKEKKLCHHFDSRTNLNTFQKNKGLIFVNDIHLQSCDFLHKNSAEYLKYDFKYAIFTNYFILVLNFLESHEKINIFFDYIYTSISKFILFCSQLK